MEDHKKRLDVEFVFADVLDDIFSYLKLKDLLNVRLVCKWWYETATKEMRIGKIRRGPEHLIIPHIRAKEFTDQSSNFHLCDLLSAKPYVAIMFVGLTKIETFKDPKYNIVPTYITHIPRYLLTVGVEDCLLDDLKVNSFGELLNLNGIIGLFLPEYKDLNIKVLMLPSIDGSNYLKILSTSKVKRTIIYFSLPYATYKALKTIKKRLVPGTYTLWGGCYDMYMQGLDRKVCKRNLFLKDQEWQDFVHEFGIILTGTCHDSWSTLIDRLTDKTTVDRQLLTFKNQLQLRRRTICLACGSKYEETNENVYKNHFELRDAVKRVLPDIPFIGIFQVGYHGCYGVDSLNEDSYRQLRREKSIALMVITFD